MDNYYKSLIRVLYLFADCCDFFFLNHFFEFFGFFLFSFLGIHYFHCWR